MPVSGAAEAAGMEVEEPDASAAVPQEVPEAAEAAEEPCREVAGPATRFHNACG